MTDERQPTPEKEKGSNQSGGRKIRRRRFGRRALLAATLGLGAAVLLAATIGWLGTRASIIKAELNAVAQLIPQLKDNVTSDKPEEAAATVKQLRSHAASARSAAEDPLWTLASATPIVGPNFSAVAEIARSTEDVTALGIAPLVNVFGSLNWDNLLPSSAGRDLTPLQKASPSIMSAAHAVRVSVERLETIDETSLVPQVAEPLTRAREQLRGVTGALDASASASKLAPSMLGADGPRNYLLMIQNNAEVRASGGIPGALAVMSLDNGKLSLEEQSTAGDVGVMQPALPVDTEQQEIYSVRLGKFMQDINLTPDFPTAARTAQAMWEKKTGQHVDGVVSIDPVTLGYMLDATGPVKLSSPELVALASGGLPTELNGKNVVSTLLSDVYSKIEQPKLQDAYFAGVAQEVFAALSSGKGDAKGLIEGLTRGTAESRVLLWSSRPDEQKAIAEYPLSGSIAGPSVAPAQFGVYFNDGTGAKMDYYVKRTVQLVEECTGDEYGQVKVRITSTNTAPADAASSLPAYVTGDGAFGVPPGTVQTNVIAYGPVQSNVENAIVDGEKSDFAAHMHSFRPVGSVTTTLAPGQSSTVELTFGKIVQHAVPNLVVTPTVQPVNDVVLATQAAECVPAT
ncbi:hypothetical protein TV39_16195 [Arthrobacter sp. SPG23]|uniref:DUF4012 domain-containing protein n=1 Tax=Arthrobacter sp. SPG23 TaxID=1610703 RepID=UPI0005BA4ABD|nr:DUF4012 domain-containing protein [Arthrobacter sp. SPG23]KIS26192.1 hypothetical protein TV39_16195 [Arthrobacter sp. SPG23]